MKSNEIIRWVVGVFFLTFIFAILLPEAFGLYFPQLTEFSGVKQALMLAVASSIITPLYLILDKASDLAAMKVHVLPCKLAGLG